MKDTDYKDLVEALEYVDNELESIAGNCRLSVIDDDVKENIIEDANSKATKKQTRYGVNIFRRTCQLYKITCNMHVEAESCLHSFVQISTFIHLSKQNE